MKGLANIRRISMVRPEFRPVRSFSQMENIT